MKNHALGLFIQPMESVNFTFATDIKKAPERGFFNVGLSLSLESRYNPGVDIVVQIAIITHGQIIRYIHRDAGRTARVGRGPGNLEAQPRFMSRPDKLTTVHHQRQLPIG